MDAFARCLPSEGGFEPEQRNKSDQMRSSDTFQGGTAESDDPDWKGKESNDDGGYSVVPGERGETVKSVVAADAGRWGGKI
jgi:hypothetical protein